MSHANIREIIATEWIDSAWSLLEAHREELTTNKDLMKLAPRREIYERLEAAGALLSLGAFVDDKLVGYSIGILDRNLHYGDLAVLQNDLFFVGLEHRARLGLRLMNETERLAAQRGARMVLWHAKQGSSFANILDRKGYRVQDIIYSRVV